MKCPQTLSFSLTFLFNSFMLFVSTIPLSSPSFFFSVPFHAYRFSSFLEVFAFIRTFSSTFILHFSLHFTPSFLSLSLKPLETRLHHSTHSLLSLTHSHKYSSYFTLTAYPQKHLSTIFPLPLDVPLPAAPSTLSPSLSPLVPLPRSPEV